MRVKSWRSGSLTRVRDAYTFAYFCSLGGVIAALFCQEVQGVENVDMEALWREHCGLPSYSTGVQTFKASGSQTERAALWLIDRGA